MSANVLRAKAASASDLLASRDILPGPDPATDRLQNDDEPQWQWIFEHGDRAPGPAAADNEWSKADRLVPNHREESLTIAATRSRRYHKSHEQNDSRIIGARLGNLVVKIGSVVTLRADRNDVWVAIITNFRDTSDRSDDESESENGDEDEDAPQKKRALFTWLSSPREIRNPRHRRADCLPNELYVTASSDVNPLEAIMGRALIVSPNVFRHRHPTGKIAKSHPDFGKLFVCRRGANLRTATYTDEFEWGVDLMQGQDGEREVEELKVRVERETQATRKRKAGADIPSVSKDFVVPEGEIDKSTPQTPHKRQKFDSVTPRSHLPKTITPRKIPVSKFTTPTHRRIVEKRPLTFTPLGTRILSPTASPHLHTPHALARTHLHVASVPTSLPCRENEFSTVFTHLESAITSSTGTCIYISGTPGTGKTATVREVVAQLHASVQAEELDDFIYVEINGMRLVDPHQSYTLLWEALTQARVAPGHALSLLTQEFSRPSPRRVPVVVLMDELDQLVTRSQGVMYNFFQWPALRHSRLIVLAVANTMDLPERTLSNKISSRLGLTRIVFQGYTHTQLMKIVETRLAAVPSVVVDSDAVQFAARKVAGVSGDARRCLDICRRAVEMAEQDIASSTDTATADEDGPAENSDDVQQPDTPSRPKVRPPHLTNGTPQSSKAGHSKNRTGRVTIPHIQRAIREAISSPLAQYLRCLPVASKLFLAGLLALSRRSGLSEALVGDVFDECGRLVRMEGGIGWRQYLLGSDADAIPSSAADAEVPEAVSVHGTPSKRGKGKTRARAKIVQAPRVLGMSEAVTGLMEGGVLAVEDGRGERGARCRILCGEEEVKIALRDDEEVRGLGFDA